MIMHPFSRMYVEEKLRPLILSDTLLIQFLNKVMNLDNLGKKCHYMIFVKSGEWTLGKMILTIIYLLQRK